MSEVKRYIETQHGLKVATDETREGDYVSAEDYDALFARVVEAERLLREVQQCGLERRTAFLCLPANIAYFLCDSAIDSAAKGT